MEERKISNQYLKIRISQEEMEALKEKYENSKALRQHRANATGNVYQEDITEVRKLADQIIAPLLELNSKLTYLKK